MGGRKKLNNHFDKIRVFPFKPPSSITPIAAPPLRRRRDGRPADINAKSRDTNIADCKIKSRG